MIKKRCKRTGSKFVGGGGLEAPGNGLTGCKEVVRVEVLDAEVYDGWSL